MTGPNTIPIFPNVLNIALPLQGLTWGVTESDSIGLQCAGDTLYASLTLTEGFATSFKTLGVPTNIPGNTQWESGYWTPGSGDGDGGATQGTRFKIWFYNVPSGVDVTVYPSINNGYPGGTDSSEDCSNSDNWVPLSQGGEPALCLYLISGADDWGAGGSLAAYNANAGVAVSIDSDGMGMIVYEVMDNNAFATESIDVPVKYTWVADTTNDEPKPGTTQMRANFAPLATSDGPYGFVADKVSPWPRFIDTGGTPEDAFSIRRCTTTLLFPWITNQSGFDTGVAISNTSADWLGTPHQQGICTVHWHGADSAGATFSDTPSGSIGAGEQFIFLVSTEAPDFQGYIIVVCEFQFAHGFAFISDGFGGVQTLAQGYLALILEEYDKEGGFRVAPEASDQ